MASNSETGHSKNTANFLTLIGVCQSYGTKYNPSKAALKITALNTTYNAADASIEKLHTTETTLDNAGNAREILFDQLKPLITRLNGAMET